MINWLKANIWGVISINRIRSWLVYPVPVWWVLLAIAIWYYI